MLDPRIRPRPTDPTARPLLPHVHPRSARLREAELVGIVRELGGAVADPAGLAEGCRRLVEETRRHRQEIQTRSAALRASVEEAGALARREALARHIRVTVASPGARRADLAALGRDLDLDALLERDAAAIEADGARLELLAEILGSLGGAADLFRTWLPEERRPATRRALVAALARDRADDPLLREILLDPAEDVWVRRRALLPAHCAEALACEEGPDAVLVRARAAELVVEARLPLLGRCLADPAELVRAVTVDALARVGELEGLRRAAGDPEPKIRARVAARLGGLGALEPLAALLRDEALVASFACDAALEAVLAGATLPPPVLAALAARCDDEPPALARRAALVLTAAELRPLPVWEQAQALAAMRPGQRWSGRAAGEPLLLARALSVFAADGFGFWVEPRGDRVRVTRGDDDTPALWRILHELRHPGPSKRQGHTHAVGRADRGAIRVPPGGLAEESATGVPGQRVRIDREGGWVPAVPMVEDFLDATWRGEVRIVTPEGITTIEAPGRLGRLRAWYELVTRFSRYDALRSAALADPDPALRGRFLDATRALGFRTTLGAGAGDRRPRTPSLAAFAAGLAPLGWLVALDPVGSVHLLLVVVLLSFVVFGRAALARRRVRRARARIPLVLGGWGTRGKSGTERLKAAAFEGLGLPMLSKTTGCEAMILHGPPGGHAVELFLFRPFDKATIWEQTRVVALAERLGARAFLWECMGLNPTYVDLLQGWWMRDDLSTLTNAYPDHEDIQGPTGMDVATVIGGFAPPDALLFTTESNMRPVLAEEAGRRRCELRAVPRVDSELMPRELMERMPHAEHPANVALAAAALGAVGVEPVEAVGLMAEHVVPDLGALVIYPRARHMGRDVVFANGMSANDTLSFKHNWRRVGFAAHDHVELPDEWLVTVVNNRADRVARTRVFASIVVNEANAHRHVFIGSNLEGLRQYVGEAMEERLAGTVLDGDPARVDALFAHLRLVDPVLLGAACRLRLGLEPDGWGAAFAGWTPRGETLAELRRAAAPLGEGIEPAELREALVEAAARWGLWRQVRTAAAPVVRAAWKELLWAAIHLVEDSHATGDQVMAAAIGAVPPGAVARIMGIQNIKGTGLDFAYQWVWWRELHGALRRLGDPARRAAALDEIERNPFGSALACDAALEALAAVERDSRVGALLRRIEARRAELLAARAERRAPEQNPFLRAVERWVDPVDSILRARRARVVFDDLAAMRISHPRAQAELKRLTDRQKGGWLRR